MQQGHSLVLVPGLLLDPPELVGVAAAGPLLVKLLQLRRGGRGAPPLLLLLLATVIGPRALPFGGNFFCC